jgi:DNA-directed RNA polymerase subunit F
MTKSELKKLTNRRALLIAEKYINNDGLCMEEQEELDKLGKIVNKHLRKFTKIDKQNLRNMIRDIEDIEKEFDKIIKKSNRRYLTDQ